MEATMETVTAGELRDAIMEMTHRYGEAERKAAYAWKRQLQREIEGRAEDAAEAGAEAERWERAAQRRYAATHRLTTCLCNLNR